MQSLSVRIPLLLGITCLCLGALLLVVLHAEPVAPSVRATGFVLATFGGAWLVAWGLLHAALRPVRHIADALEAHQRGDCRNALRLPAGDPRGDELARLSAHVEAMTQTIADQADALAQGERRRSEFLASFSHDLRTPLASMQGFIELLLMRHDSLEPLEARNYLQTAARQSERLSRLVNDLFELSRLDTGLAQPQPEPFALVELAHDVVQKYSHEAGTLGVSLNMRCAEGFAAVLVDADIAMVARVLDDLVGRALRHTPAGGDVTMEVSCGQARARMAVRDSGISSAADEMTSLLERYGRAARVGVTTGDISDAGDAQADLGLAIARRIVTLHGSQLTVQHQPGRGTLVWFDLALAGAPPPTRTLRCSLTR